MSGTQRFLTSLVSFFRPSRGTRPPATQPNAVEPNTVEPHATQPGVSRPRGMLAGQTGASATVEVDPHRIGAVQMTYSPTRDGDPDPGEIVWTWVPYEENDGRGKDRPVIIVAVEKGGSLLAVQLTSKDHTGEGTFVELGTGSWDREGRLSWANIDRVFRVWPAGMRREAAALDAARYQRVKAAIARRYGWR